MIEMFETGQNWAFTYEPNLVEDMWASVLMKQKWKLLVEQE